MLNTVLALISTGADVYQMVSDIRSGNETRLVVQQLERLNRQVERLSEHIFYAPGLHSVRDVKNIQQEKNNLHQVHDFLNPVQQVFGSDILASAVIKTPAKMQDALKKNPWEVLFDIRPVNLATRPSNPDMVPILFDFNDMSYVGWQLRGTMPVLFDCEYTSLLDVANLDKFIPSAEKLRNIIFWVLEGRYESYHYEFVRALPNEKRELALFSVWKLLGVTDGTVKEQQSFLQELYSVVLEELIENDLPYLTPKESSKRIKSIYQVSGANDQLITELQKQLPDLENRLLDSSLQLKSEMLKERIKGMKEFYASNRAAMKSLNQAHTLFLISEWKECCEVLNGII